MRPEDQRPETNAVFRFKLQLQPIDAALLLMTVIWGSNFTVVKIAVRDIPELAFNAIRLFLASTAFLVTVAVRSGFPQLSRSEWWRIVLLALVGHVLYQICFIAGVTRTTVANSALIFAFTPIAVALLTAAVGHEPVPITRWAGAAISVSGIYLVVGGSIGAPGATMFGNVMAVGAMLCWATFTVSARPLLRTLSPEVVTGYSMAIGSFVYLPLALPELAALEWSRVRMDAWLALAASALLALYVAYMIWYTAVQKIGSTRTSVYSNVTPLAAMVVARIWLGEPITAQKLIGAGAVIAGLAVTKLERRVITLPEA
jgi:drug/metabolite transporter (DMT)-like permease